MNIRHGFFSAKAQNCEHQANRSELPRKEFSRNPILESKFEGIRDWTTLLPPGTKLPNIVLPVLPKNEPVAPKTINKYYRRPDGKWVQITAVYETEETGRREYRWDDAVYMGPVEDGTYREVPAGQVPPFWKDIAYPAEFFTQVFKNLPQPV